MQIEQVCCKVHLAIRRCKTKGKSYTVGYILKDDMRESLVRLDEGYKIIDNNLKFASILGKSKERRVCYDKTAWFTDSVFFSLSANDLHWSELIAALGKLVDCNDYTAAIESNTLFWETRSRLVQVDPVTSNRHFDQRVLHFIETIQKSPVSPFAFWKTSIELSFNKEGLPVYICWLGFKTPRSMLIATKRKF